MHSSTLLYALSAAAILITRKLDDPVSQYLSRMCLPLWSNATRSMELGISVGDQVASLSESPFPCERAMYIAAACTANGTSEIDFLAEQECLCHGSYWEAEAGCNSCHFVHGNTYSSPSKAASYLTSLSMAECTPSPPTQAFSNLTPPVNLTALTEAPPMTLGHDQFPNNTAVSNYFTPTGEMTLGQITGTATARLTSWTNFAGVRYTPTTTVTGKRETQTAATNSAVASSSSTGPPKNSGATLEFQVAGCLVSIGLGLAIIL
ncbi:unnamed protein product [Penicillium pancosmium]